MGCALETMEEILAYLHRESIVPNYLKDLHHKNEGEVRSKEEEIDNQGCTPRCVAHTTFGIDLVEML